MWWGRGCLLGLGGSLVVVLRLVGVFGGLRGRDWGLGTGEGGGGIRVGSEWVTGCGGCRCWWAKGADRIGVSVV
jgi:hypothetical protein